MKASLQRSVKAYSTHGGGTGWLQIERRCISQVAPLSFGRQLIHTLYITPLKACSLFNSVFFLAIHIHSLPISQQSAASSVYTACQRIFHGRWMPGDNFVTDFVKYQNATKSCRNNSSSLHTSTPRILCRFTDPPPLHPR